METTRKLASFIANTSFEGIPGDAINIAKRQILDTVVVALAGSLEPVSKLAVQYVKEMGGKPKASVIAIRLRSTTPNAAWANGIMSHVLDYDDDGVYGHCSVTLVPAILALGEELRASGKEVIEAYVLGFETGASLAAGFTYSGYTVAHGGSDQVHGLHRTAILGTMAAAAACARLSKLDVEQTSMTLGYAASTAAGVLRNIGTMTKSVHVGNTCRNGVVAAQMVKRGMTAAIDVLESRLGYCYAVLGQGNYDLEKMTKDLGDHFSLTKGIGVKKYPCCYANHWALDAILALIKEHGIRCEEVEAVEVGEDPTVGTILFYHDPKTGLEGKFSMEYNMAAALLDGKVTMDTFTDEKAQSPQMRQMMKKVKVTVHPDWPTGRLMRRNPVTVRFKDGKQVSNPGDKLAGAAELPLTREEMVTKYRDCARLVLSPRQVERSLELMENLEDVKDVTELMDILVSRKRGVTL